MDKAIETLLYKNINEFITADEKIEYIYSLIESLEDIIYTIRSNPWDYE